VCDNLEPYHHCIFVLIDDETDYIMLYVSLVENVALELDAS